MIHYISTLSVHPHPRDQFSLYPLLCSLWVFFTLFVKLGHNHCRHFTETSKIWSFYVSFIYDTKIEGMRVESR